MKVAEHAYNYASFYENLNDITPKNDYKKFFDENSYFEDPFHKVNGVEQIYPIFEKMYKTLVDPIFSVDEVICSNSVAYIRWEFRYSLSKSAKTEKFTGISRVEFNHHGLVISHIDYWDAAVHVYEKIPIIGSILRFIKRKIND